MFTRTGVSLSSRFSRIQRALLHLYEFQSKALLQKRAINVQPFVVLDNKMSVSEISDSVKSFSSLYPQSKLVIKAQILAGGRGKGHFLGDTDQAPTGDKDDVLRKCSTCAIGKKGGIQIALSTVEAAAAVNAMLDRRLVTAQTSPDGLPVEKVIVAKAVDIHQEAYLAILLDRQNRNLMFICSPYGGMDIEDVAKKNPLAISKFSIPLEAPCSPGLLENIATSLGFPLSAEVFQQISLLHETFCQSDALQIEVNPFALVSEDTTTNIKTECTQKVSKVMSKTPNLIPMAIDLKMEIDDSALFRQRELDWIGPQSSLSFVKLDGQVGSLVNGAGLAMATMDLINAQPGGTVANFLDVGGSATSAQIAMGFSAILADPKVQSIFVNIFGGIMRCDVVAHGLVAALSNYTLKRIPTVVVRFAGTYLEEAYHVLRNSGFNFQLTEDMADGAATAVAAARNNNQ